jgi:hypothetical protein
MKAKSTVSVVSCLFFAFLSIAGCASPVDDVGVRDLRWKQLAAFAGDVNEYAHYLTEHDMRSTAGNEFAYMGREPRLLVLTDVTDMAALQNHVRLEHQHRIAKVDFSRFWVAVIYRGYTKHLGHVISIDAVQFLSDTVTIAAQFEAPPTSTAADVGYQPTAYVSPYLVVRIWKPANVIADGLHFDLSVDGQIIPAHCALEGAPASWTKLRNFGRSDYGGQSPALEVIVDYDTWKASGRVPDHDVALMSPEDFSLAFVMVVYQGLKSTTGFETEILSVRHQDNTMMVCVRFHEPYPGQGLGQAMTSPYYMIKVDRTAEMQGETTFVLCTDKQEISRQAVTLP